MVSDKLINLAESARYDVCMSSCAKGSSGRQGRSRKPDNPLKEWIYPASVPGQGEVHILKILQSNSCRNNCSYCQFASSNGGIKRISLSPDELAASFMSLVYSRLVAGIFLSSGVCRSPAKAMEDMVKTADIIRNRYSFKGYIHLKIIPGSPEHLIDKAASLANRLSINMETPTEHHLLSIAPDKKIKRDIIPAISRISKLLQAQKNGCNNELIRTASQTTQFVVGAADEKDFEIMTAVDKLYRDYYMFRAYFSAFQKRWSSKTDSSVRPMTADRSYSSDISGSSANPYFSENNGLEGSPLLREHRLYQCDFLLRAYGFRFPDLVFDSMGNIPLETDPKTAWAMLNPQLYPVEINKADFNTLLRVPGIGPVAAERIIRMRRANRISDIETLKGSGAWIIRAAGWIELNGRSPVFSESEKSFIPKQGWLFEELSPKGWRQAGSINQKNRADDKGTKADEKAAQIKSAAAYSYPGQEGKWVNYQFRKSDKKVWCR